MIRWLSYWSNFREWSKIACSFNSAEASSKNLCVIEEFWLSKARPNRRWSLALINFDSSSLILLFSAILEFYYFHLIDIIIYYHYFTRNIILLQMLEGKNKLEVRIFSRNLYCCFFTLSLILLNNRIFNFSYFLDNKLL
jgi:hypothetical protein